MRASVKEAKALAFIEAVLLVALALLSAGSEPPVVDIPSVPSIDEGTVVRVSGHVVDIWAGDDGSENLVLADLASGATLRALCRPCPGAQPSDRASIGDLVSATGEVARSGLQTMLVVEAGGIVLVSRSEEALGLEELVVLSPGKQRYTLAGRIAVLPLGVVASADADEIFPIRHRARTRPKRSP